ncbi:MAG: hypothetical protein R3F33_03945 [Planctomycetota bacterium]
MVTRFRELYGLREETAIARELKCPVATVRAMAEELFSSSPKQGPWSDDEVEQLRAYLGASSMDALCRVMGRSQIDIENKLVELALTKTEGEWSQEDVARFKRLYGTRRDEDLAIIFARRLDDVQGLADKLCIAKDKAFLRRQSKKEGATRMPRWGSQDLELLKELYPAHSNLDIARRLQRSVKSVVSKAHNLGLRKDPERLKEMGRENVSLRYGNKHSDAGH